MRACASHVLTQLLRIRPAFRFASYGSTHPSALLCHAAGRQAALVSRRAHVQYVNYEELKEQLELLEKYLESQKGSSTGDLTWLKRMFQHTLDSEISKARCPLSPFPCACPVAERPNA